MTTAGQELDLDELRSWIGREAIATDVVSADLVGKFHATFDLPGGVPQFGDVAPRLIHFCLAQQAVPTAMLGPDGHPQRGGFLPPIPLPRRMWAGGRLSFHQDLHVGDAVRRVSRIADVTVKDGRTGRLCFVTVEHTVTSQDRLVLEERQDLVYRGSQESALRTTPTPADRGRHQRRVDPSPVLLFRYSALTFNGHRIHYDRRYASEVEGYPGLVVHGPMQATLLLDFATELHGRSPSRFAFRSLSPLFDDRAFLLHAEEEGGGLKLWSARADGPVAMTAEAAWD
jgi:3-methylfumaryl-CoA hydratase